jgi:tetratricopeptide (TPR) repeat protein
LTAELRSPPNDAKTLTALANAAEGRAFAGEASQLYERTIGKVPGALSNAGRTAWYAGQRERALSLLARAITTDTTTAQIHYLYGEALKASRNREAARGQFERARDMTASKTGREDRRLHIMALARLGQYDEANALLAAGPARDDTAVAGYASVLLDEGQTQRAGEVLGRSQTR